ncbi:MAG: 50S ribosomal protein L30 [Myxococcales bacterium]
MALRIKLVRGLSGHPEDHRATVRGLGLTRVGRVRVLEDNPAVRGMVKKVGYLLEVEETQEQFQKFGRRARAKSQREASGKAPPSTPSTVS